MIREEVERAVRKLCNGKAAGQDEVVAELLKYGGEVVIGWLTEVIQQVWQSGNNPQEWIILYRCDIDPSSQEAS